MLVPLETARGRLAVVWFGGSAIFFIVLVLQSLGGVFGNQLDKAWAWALPNIAPTLSLMVSVFAAYALMTQSEEDKMKVRRTFLRLAFGLSIFYMANLVLVVSIAPFTAGNGIGVHPVDVMHVSNFWLGPLQGLTAAALAALFFTKGN